MIERKPQQRRQSPARAPQARQVRHYRISTAPGSQGELQHLSVDCESVRLPRQRPRCFEWLEARDRPCDHCPAFASGAADQHRSIVLPTSARRDGLRLVTARRNGRTADVLLYRLPADALPQLIAGKLQQLASSAGLTRQEQRLLQLLVLGRSTTEMARALAITRHTVKFHQRNALDKLGADGRHDVLRLLQLDER